MSHNTTPYPPPPPGYGPGSPGSGWQGPPPKQWYQRKGFVIPAVIVGVVIVFGALGAIVGDPKDGSKDAGGTPTRAASSAQSTAAPSSSPAATSKASTQPAPSSTTPAVADGGGADSWVMPDETGMDLQDAQNDIQHLTAYSIFVTKSHDASGRGRFQVIDHDWQVCSQNIAAGQRITEDSKIVFDVVKQDETCP